jgi:hypothetical protein
VLCILQGDVFRILCRQLFPQGLKVVSKGAPFGLDVEVGSAVQVVKDGLRPKAGDEMRREKSGQTTAYRYKECAISLQSRQASGQVKRFASISAETIAAQEDKCSQTGHTVVLDQQA